MFLKLKFNNFSPKVGIQLHPNDDVMVYGSYSEGYKTGGWTTRLTNPQGNVAPDFDEEVAETLGISVTQVKRDFAAARLWLKKALRPEESG